MPELGDEPPDAREYSVAMFGTPCIEDCPRPVRETIRRGCRAMLEPGGFQGGVP
jgi:hypothetical protein